MSRAEYMREYRKKQQEKKQQDYKDQLSATQSENSWFEPDRNFYLNPISLVELKKWNEEYEKRFNLKCRIDGVEPNKKLFQLQCAEKDLRDRCVYWRIFCNSVFARKKKFPTEMECLVNNVFKPDVSERPDLLPLFAIKEDDPLMDVSTTLDWAAQDNFIDDIVKMGFKEEDYNSFLKDRKSSDETRREFLIHHDIDPNIKYIYTYGFEV